MSTPFLGGEGPGLAAAKSMKWGPQVAGIHNRYQKWGYLDPFPVLTGSAKRWEVGGRVRGGGDRDGSWRVGMGVWGGGGWGWGPRRWFGLARGSIFPMSWVMVVSRMF